MVDSIQRPPPLSTIPKGLLGFLGIKSGGRYPQNLAEVLAPVWDVRDHYLASYAATFLQGPITLAAGGVIADLNFGTTIGFVPNAEYAYVTRGVIRCDLAGKNAVTATPCAFVNGLGIPQGPTLTFAAGGLATWQFDRPFWLPPGSAFGVIVNAKTAGDALDFLVAFESVIFPT